MVARQRLEQEPRRVDVPRDKRRPVHDKTAQPRAESGVLAERPLDFAGERDLRLGALQTPGGLIDSLVRQTDDATFHERRLPERPAEHRLLRHALEELAVDLLEDE